MKKISIILTIIVAILAGCNRWEEPEFNAPVYNGPAANKTIADIKAMHPSLGNGTQDSICHYNEQFIVKAVVVLSRAAAWLEMEGISLRSSGLNSHMFPKRNL